ncbi:Protein CBG07941 [Caenorhabditis briggsae]|uniref:Protein CBG07941 n=1 Tax=Caenorhabditis briggsae TaxID=6238 RepID=A8X5F0_CAEBR|nr:Protein CBG07941 [Caenorhabditis briggsae]CAP27861.2 Protein CBG07941 [Caenorhabditis briggsae]
MRVNHYVMVFCLIFGILANIYVIVKLNIGTNLFEYLQKIQMSNIQRDTVPKCEIDADHLLNFIENRHFLELEEKEQRKIPKNHEKTLQTMLFAFPTAGLGNKLFEIISLLGIADTLQRTPVINATNSDYINVLSKSIQPIFPKLVEEFDLKIIPSFKYFHHIRPKIRELLAPSKLTAVRAEILLPTKYRNDFIICTHIRRGDFQYDGVHQPSDATFTRSATDFLVDYYKKSRRRVTVVVLGNDIHFAKAVFEAPSSTFGWWLSYLSKRKSQAYYRDITESKDGVLREMREDDFYPPEWIKLKTDQKTGKIRKIR